MSDMREEMRERWNAHADSYDGAHAHGVDSPTQKAQWLALLRGVPGGKLLDVGTGTGFVSLLAAENGYTVTGLDWSSGMMSIAEKKALEAGLHIDFVQAETERLPFEDGGFEIVTARHVLWTLADPVAALREWLRVLAPGGHVVADYTPRTGPIEAHHYSLEIERELPLNRDVSREAVEALFREAGFSGVTATEAENVHHHGEAADTPKTWMFVCEKA